MGPRIGYNLDTLLISLRPWGKWQVRQITVQMMLTFPFCCQLLSVIILAPFPRFRCKTFNDTVLYHNASSLDTWDQCDVTDPITNSSAPCTQGFDYSLSVDRSLVTEWDLVCSRQWMVELSQTAYTVGQCIGTTIFMLLADRYGRKWVCLVNLWISIVFGVVTAFCQSPVIFILLRLVSGIFHTGFIMVVTVIAMELVPIANRHYMSLWGGLNWALSVTVFSLLGYLCRDVPWRYSQIILTAPCLLVILNMWFLDESVRWLFANGKYNIAKKLITKAATVNRREDHPGVRACISYCDEQFVFNQQKPESNQEMTYRAVGAVDSAGDNTEDNTISEDDLPKTDKLTSPLELLKHKKLRLFTGVMLFTWMVHGWVYLGLLLTSSSLAGDPYLNLFLNAVVELPAAVVTFYCIEKIGRKYTGVIFDGVTAMALAISAILQLTSGSGGSTAITAFSIIGKFAVSISFGVLFQCTPELFPTNLRSFGLGLAGSASRVGQMVAPYSTLMIRAFPWLPGFMYSFATLICLLLFLLLPETRDKSLPQTIADVDKWFDSKSRDADKTEANAHTKTKYAEML